MQYKHYFCILFRVCVFLLGLILNPMPEDIFSFVGRSVTGYGDRRLQEKRPERGLKRLIKTFKGNMKTGFKRNWLMKMVVAFSDGSKSCVMRDCIF